MSTIIHLISADGCCYGFLLDKLKASIRKSRTCSPIRNHYPILSSFVTYYRVCSKNITTDATIEAETACLIAPHDITPVLSGVRIWHSLVFCSVLYIIVIHVAFFVLAIAFCVFRYTNCDYPLGIYNLNSLQTKQYNGKFVFKQTFFLYIFYLNFIVTALSQSQII
jgi:hypothetical protein